MPAHGSFLDGYFMLSERGSNLRREIVAGLTMFATMSYVLAVHPYVMSLTGMDRAAMVTVTCGVAATFTLIVGLWAGIPLAMAPGMGVNAFFAFTLCLTMGIPWQAALGLVFWSGVLMVLLAATGVRQMLLKSFPDSIKHALTAGIGMFIVGIGLKIADVVVGAPPPVYVKLGEISLGPALLALGGLILTLVLFL